MVFERLGSSQGRIESVHTNCSRPIFPFMSKTHDTFGMGELVQKSLQEIGVLGFILFDFDVRALYTYCPTSGGEQQRPTPGEYSPLANQEKWDHQGK